jgi:acetyl-CoA carboxylase carboxyl transferase subunit alpha
MLENSVYSVISPEGCAAILWKDSDRKADAAEAMKLTAPDLLGLGVIDRVIGEPVGGAHADPEAAIDAVGTAVDGALGELVGKSPEALVAERYQKFRRIGVFLDER